MTKNALETFVESVRADWGPLSTEVIAACTRHMRLLLQADILEPWLAGLHREQPLARELYRDPDHGFVLMAHSEPYGRVEAAVAQPRLVKRNTARVEAGGVQVYLPGDIHDTRCSRGPALLFRFTERDLKIEDKVEGKITRYVDRDGVWTTAKR